MTSDSDDSRRVYDAWAADYETDVKEWGYDMPNRVATLLAKHTASAEMTSIWDAGCGDGLSGVELRKHFPKQSILGSDLSAEMLKVAKGRGCYTSLKHFDLNKYPYALEDAAFDAITCVGTLTYVEPGILQEFCRIVKPGGLVCYTNRSDRLQKFEVEEARLEKESCWRLIEKLGPLPYLPNHTDYAEKVQVYVYAYQSTKGS